jgi:O-antigen ligase
MNLKHYYANANGIKIIDFLFVFLVFVLPFVSYSFVLNPVKIGQELYLVSVIALWIFYSAISFFKTKLFKIQLVDVLFFVFLLYCVLHYYCYSYFGFLHNEFWVLSSYILLFYLFKWSFGSEQQVTKLFDFSIKIIWFFCFLQSIVGLLQQLDYLKSDNDYFKVVGTFINPNFLGVNMTLGLMVVLYQFLFQFQKNKILQSLLIASAIAMGCVLFITQSRASWMALCVGVLILLGTSEQSVLFIKNYKKKALGILSAIVFLGVSSLYLLYKMDADSVDGRTFIHEITLSKITQKPILGNGILNFTGIYNDAKATYFLTAKRPWAELKVGDYVAVALNDYLQVVFEIGFIGLVLMALILFFVLKGIPLNPKTRLGLAILICFCFLALFTSVLYNPNAMIYGIWALSILVVFGKVKTPIVTIKNRFFINSLAILLLAMSCFVGFVFYKKTVALSSFKTVVDNPDQKIYYKLDDFSLQFIQEDPYVEFRIGYEKYQDGDTKMGLQMMENSVKKDPIPKANTALADLYFKQKNIARAEQLLQSNIGIEPSRFEPLANLMQFYAQTNQVEKQFAMAQKIIDLPVKIASPEVMEYKKKAQAVVELYDKNEN